MIKGPFNIEVSKKAEKLQIENLTEEEKKTLLHGVKFDSRVHDVYKFSIIPVIKLIDARKLSRKLKRKSFDRTNIVLVHTRVGITEIEFLNIFPTTCTREGRWTLDLTAEGKLELLQKGVGKLMIAGIFKHKIRKENFSIYAGHHSYFAQWIFLEPWIKTVSDFKIEILCMVPKKLRNEDRFIICDTQFKENSRVLKSALKRKVELN